MNDCALETLSTRMRCRNLYKLLVGVNSHTIKIIKIRLTWFLESLANINTCLVCWKHYYGTAQESPADVANHCHFSLYVRLRSIELSPVTL